MRKKWVPIALLISIWTALLLCTSVTADWILNDGTGGIIIEVPAEVVAEGTCGDALEWSLDQMGELTISGSGAMTSHPWGSHFKSITRVVIENGVTSIADSAFAQCSNLAKITIPDSVTSIGTYAFEQCESLTSVVLPADLTKLSTGVFHSCYNLTSVTLPDGLVVIGETAFANCINLPSITIPNSVVTIADEAFDNCGSLTSVTVPASVTSIGMRAFADCSSLEAIQVAADNVGYCSVDGVLFTKDTTELVQYPAGAPRTSYAIPEGTSEIVEYAFYGSNNLLQVSVPASVTTFGAYIFCNCENLRRVDLSEGITTLSENMFYGCSSLVDVILPESLTTIGADAFYYCRSLADITLPESLTTIGSSAFWGCESLTGIVIPDGVTDLVNTFYNCESLTDVTLPEGLTSIGRNTFSSCAIREIEIPSSVTSIGNSAFAHCNSLREITIPDTVTTIGDSAFYDCKGLVRAKLSNRITVIDRYLFQNCSSLTVVNIPDGVTSIGYEAFQGCGNLVGLEIPDGVTTIEYNAFANCGNLTDVFYGGDAATWSEITTSSGIGDEVQLFSSDRYDNSIAVSIITTDVSGGVAVTMSSSGGTIYYTLDGSTPCSASIPYEGPFLLNEAGDHFINARAIDLSAMTYGDVSSDYVALEQSAAPEIAEQYDLVYLTAPGDIYYTLDLTQIPNTENYLYTGPLYFDKTTVFRARTIQPGYAPSEVVNYTYYKLVDNGMDYPSESYSFGNVRASFGYTGLSYKIPQIRYTEIFGNTMGQLLYSVYGGNSWGGSCFGMSTTALMFHDGQLALSDYSDQADTVYDLLAPASKESALTQLIERYQVSQFLPVVMAERNDASEGGTMVVSGIPGNGIEGAALVDAVRQACSGGEPVVLIVQNNKGGFHAVVPYRTQGNQIYVYDCNAPGGDHCITYTISDSNVYSFSYGQYSYSIACNRMTTLLEGLENLYAGGAALSSEEKEMFLLSSSSGNLTVLDADGHEVTEYLRFRPTEDMHSANMVFYLEKGTYTIVNNTSTPDGWTLSAATEQDYYAVTIADSTAQVELGEKYGHLYITVTAEDATEIQVYATNSDGRENELSATADSMEIYACTEKAILIRTITETEVVGNGDGLLMSPGQDGYEGAAIQRVVNSARETYVQGACTLCTDITELSGSDFVLTMYVSGAGDSGTLCVASYDEAGRMIGLSTLNTVAGKTKYVLSIGADAARVNVLLLDGKTSTPLTTNVLLQ